MSHTVKFQVVRLERMPPVDTVPTEPGSIIGSANGGSIQVIDAGFADQKSSKEPSRLGNSNNNQTESIQDEDTTQSRLKGGDIVGKTNKGLLSVSPHAAVMSDDSKIEVIDLLVSPVLEPVAETITDTIESIHNTTNQSSHISMPGLNNNPQSLNISQPNLGNQRSVATPLDSTYQPAKTFLNYQNSSNYKSASSPRIKHRLLLLCDKLRFYHLIMHLSDLRRRINEKLVILEIPQFNKLVNDEYISKIQFDCLNINIEYSDNFESNLKTISNFLKKHSSIIKKIPDISYLVHFSPSKKWRTGYKLQEKQQYNQFLQVLNDVAGDNVVQCSILNKYDMDTVYITDERELDTLGTEIQHDIKLWKNLKILDFGESSIRFLPGIILPECLEVLNIGGGYALETLTGFNIPSRLKVLLAGQGALHSIDNVILPPFLERLELCDNKIYYLSYVNFPPNLKHLDISLNRIDNLRGVEFPNSLISLNVGYNPIENFKNVRFPDNLQYLDVSNTPNESMSGVRFPDLLVNLNLQSSVINTRGLRLPLYLSTLCLSDNFVNSINPLRLPNTLSVLYLNNNSIKTLSKVQFPSNLRELYLGNNNITTLRNVHFPPTLEVLDIEMDPDYEDNEKYITTLKDVILPPQLKVLKLTFNSIKIIESYEFPSSLTTLNLAYNGLRIFRNIRFGDNLKVLDLSGNSALTNIDQVSIPESVTELRVAPDLAGNLPAYIVERVNRKQILLKQSMPF